LVGVTCEFCNRSYTFIADDARALFAAGGPGTALPPDLVRH
jgi:hypothetical protein